jgi:DNA-binding MarR family transcriptional regulator
MPEKPPFSPTVALLTIGRVWDAALADTLKPIGLTTRKYGLLGHIRATPGVSFSELARRSRITVQSAHTAVAAFAADGLVEDATARAGAASRLQVTAAGERLLGGRRSGSPCSTPSSPRSTPCSSRPCDGRSRSTCPGAADLQAA